MDEEMAEIMAALDQARGEAEVPDESNDGGSNKKKSELEETKKKLKIWQYVGIGASIAFAGALLWAITK